MQLGWSPAVRVCLLAALAVGVSAAADAQTPAQKRAEAAKQFARAEQARAALEAKPEAERTLGEYRSLIRSYRAVYLITPHAAEATSALMAVGDLYQTLGRRFGAKHFQSAVDAYQFLIHEYPQSKHRQEALLAVGRLQQNEMKALDAAELTYQDFLKRFPRSAEAANVRLALEEIAAARQKLAQRPATPAELPQRAESVKASVPSQEQPKPSEAISLDGPRAVVTNIRHWNADNYTRVVVDLEGEVKFQSARISNPERIYFDLYPAVLRGPLEGVGLPHEEGFLTRMRVAQNQTGVVRLVLEVRKAKDYSVSMLENPYRLVVNVIGETVTLAKSNNPAEPPRVEKPAEKSKAGPAKPGPGPAQPESAAARDAAASIPAPRKTLPTKKGGDAATASVPEPTRNGQHSLTRALGLKISRIVIDPGHGGHDTGTVGPGGLMEKDLSLDVALRLGKRIREKLPSAEVVYTRQDDSYVSLESRTALANQSKADLFISIHANSSRQASVRGVETYYLSFATSSDALEVAATENRMSQASLHELQDLVEKIANNEKREESRELAEALQGALSTRLQRVSKQMKNRGVRRAPFIVLVGANMPSVLAEVSFLSNPTEERLLKRAEHRERIAEGLFHGVQSYLESINSLSTLAAKQQTSGDMER